MAGKSSKGKNRKASKKSNKARTNANDDSTTGDTNVNAAQDEPGSKEETQVKQDDIKVFPVMVKIQSGETIELELSPADSVIDVRQFLLDASVTCFFTCYELLLHTKDGSVHHLEDHHEISQVADITTGDCLLEMVPALYDDRSIRGHVKHSRDLLSLSTLHYSLSTSLALQHEKDELTTDSSKINIPELDNLKFVESASSSLINLLSPPTKEIKCVESIALSSFNPPPSYRRLLGDLIYLDVVTLEGNSYCITGTTKMFYTNSSTGSIFDPRLSESGFEASTLIGLIQKISTKFNEGFGEVLERKSSVHPFECAPCVLPSNQWLGSYPIPGHNRDAARAENSLTLSFGSKLVGMQRDWNEELQSCREFPHTTPRERIVRDRGLYKITSDFVESAVEGAIGVINTCIPPINPTDPSSYHMYVHNNIFFSFALDADLEKIHDVPKSTQLSESEQATYASANNDLKGTKAYQKADIPGLYHLAMAIIDYRGHRIVAQSVLPGILQGDKTRSVLYGSVDNGKKINWNQHFHSKVLTAAKYLHMKEHTVSDGSGTRYKLATPIECKGIIGSDERQYLLDLMRVTPRDANYTEPGSRFHILRPELITAYCLTQSEASDSEILFNPNVFTEFKLAGSPEEIVEDMENVRDLGLYLKSVVIPKFIQDVCALEVSPMDGLTLIDALHSHGINIRYIGKVADGTKHMPHLYDLCCNEIIVRSAKHLLKEILRDTEDHDLAHAISHFFNCLFGNIHSEHRNKVTYRRSSRKHDPLFSNVTSDNLWANIREFSLLKYQFNLPDDAQLRVKKIPVIRNLCNKVGVTIVARSYNLDEVSPFEISDILDLKPVVKHSIPVSSSAMDLIEKGKIQLAEGMLNEAYSLFSDAFAIYREVTGPMHKEVANCCRYLAMVLYHSGDLNRAILHQTKELIINERVLGLDHPDIVHSYGNMALFYHGLKKSSLALKYMSRTLLVLSLSSGAQHPDVAATFINLAMMYQDNKNMNSALRYLQEALTKNQELLGEGHLQTSMCYHGLAIAFNTMGAYNLAYNNEKKTYDILVKKYGEEDVRTIDSLNWLKSFQKRELQSKMKKKEAQAQALKEDTTETQKAMDMLKASPHLVQAFQASLEDGGTSQVQPVVDKKEKPKAKDSKS